MKFPEAFFFIVVAFSSTCRACRVNSNRHQLDSRCWCLMELYWLRYAEAGSDFCIYRISFLWGEREKLTRRRPIMFNINTMVFLEGECV